MANVIKRKKVKEQLQGISKDLQRSFKYSHMTGENYMWQMISVQLPAMLCEAPYHISDSLNILQTDK